MSVFVAVAAQTLLHLPLGKIPSLKKLSDRTTSWNALMGLLCIGT